MCHMKAKLLLSVKLDLILLLVVSQVLNCVNHAINEITDWSLQSFEIRTLIIIILLKLSLFAAFNMKTTAWMTSWWNVQIIIQICNASV